MIARLRAYFFAGLLVTAPIFITVTVAFWIIEFVDAKIVPLVPAEYNPDTYMREHVGLDIGLPGLGIVILLVFITLVGALTAGLAGRWVIRVWESFLNTMPFVRSIYGGTKQILETVLHSNNDAFRQAVLVEYPRRGLWAVAFVTSDTKGEVAGRLPGTHVNVFLPTTPNPTSGFLLFVPKEDTVPLGMPVEEAIKMVISAGIVTPGAANGQVEGAPGAAPEAITVDEAGRRKLLAGQAEDA